MENIVVKNLNKSFKDRKVLENFSHVFPVGKTTVIMGESGCGKTTLLNILMGVDKDFSGEIIGIPEKFGVVFQENRLCEEFSVLSNIEMVTKSEDAKSKIMDILREMDIDEFAEKKVMKLSGGQKRRVAIARALAYEGELLIMDEPFKGLDENTRNLVAEAVKKRAKNIIMVSHDPAEAELMEAEVITIHR